MLAVADDFGPDSTAERRSRHLARRQEMLFRRRTGYMFESRLQNGRWLRFTMSPTRDGGAVDILTDITALKQAEQRLRRIEERELLSYELLHNMTLEVTRLGIEVHNMKMRVESLNTRLDFAERRARALEFQRVVDKLLVEMLADDRATRRLPRETLARALYKVGSADVPDGGLAVVGAAADEIVDHFLGDIDAPDRLVQQHRQIAAIAGDQTCPLGFTLEVVGPIAGEHFGKDAGVARHAIAAPEQGVMRRLILEEHIGPSDVRTLPVVPATVLDEVTNG